MYISFSDRSSIIDSALNSLVCVDNGGKEETSWLHQLVRLEVRLREVEHGGVAFLMVPNLLGLRGPD